jgi:hypothetical protein
MGAYCEEFGPTANEHYVFFAHRSQHLFSIRDAGQSNAICEVRLLGFVHIKCLNMSLKVYCA